MFAVNLKNIVNELYAKDCAEKVRAIKKSKLEQGCYIGGIPSYGYCVKWEDGKRGLSPEEGTSDVVKCIYELFPGCIINAFTGLQITGNLGVCIVKKGGD